jgi:hypothetical protein
MGMVKMVVVVDSKKRISLLRGQLGLEALCWIVKMRMRMSEYVREGGIMKWFS